MYFVCSKRFTRGILSMIYPTGSKHNCCTEYSVSRSVVAGVFLFLSNIKVSST